MNRYHEAWYSAEIAALQQEGAKTFLTFRGVKMAASYEVLESSANELEAIADRIAAWASEFWAGQIRDEARTVRAVAARLRRESARKGNDDDSQ